MNKIKKLVTFTGHRSEKSPHTLELNRKLLDLIKKEVITAIKTGHNTFFTGMSYGFDLLAGAIILELKKEYSINLVAAVPFYGQEKNWSGLDVREYHRILSLCDDIQVGYDGYRRGAYYDRDKFMVDSSHLVIAYSNGSGGTQYTVNYAESKGVPVINLYGIC